METVGRWTSGGLALLLAVGLAACGSQSGADEAGAGTDSASVEATSGSAGAAMDAGEAAVSESTAGTRAGEPVPERRAAARRPAGGAATGTAAGTTEAATGTSDATAETGRTVGAEPAPEPVSEPATATIAAGTAIQATLDDEISTKTARVGDGFSATVSAPVVEGRTVLVPAGATLRGEVTGVQKKSGDQEAALVLALRTLTIEGQPYRLQASLTSVTPKTEREMKEEGKKIGGGAAAGGLLGAIIGGDVKGAVIGAAAGAAAGTVVTLATREEHAVLPAGSAMELELNEALSVRM